MTPRFRLARVLGVRTQLRRVIQDEVALLGAQLAGLRTRVAEARAAQAQVQHAVETATGVGVTGAELRQFGMYERALAGRETVLVAESLRVAEAIARGREELLARRRDERKLERLRDRAEVRAQQEEARQEALLIDDHVMRQRR